MSIPPPAGPHDCDLPYPYKFTDEKPGYIAPDPEDEPWSAGKRFVDIDSPRFPEGHLQQCPVCGRWWIFRRGEIPPTPSRQIPYVSVVQCTTTYRPRWQPVRRGDFAIRRRIAAHQKGTP